MVRLPYHLDLAKRRIPIDVVVIFSLVILQEVSEQVGVIV